MARPLRFKEHVQTTLPEGNLEKLAALSLPGETNSEVVRRAILEWVELHSTEEGGKWDED